MPTRIQVGVVAGASVLGFVLAQVAQGGMEPLPAAGWGLGALHAVAAAAAALLALGRGGGLAGGVAGALVAALPLVVPLELPHQQVGLLLLCSLLIADRAPAAPLSMVLAGLALGLAALLEPRIAWLVPLLLLGQLRRPLAAAALVLGLLLPAGAVLTTSDEPPLTTLATGQGLAHARALHPWAGVEPRDDLRLPEEAAARAERARLIASRRADRWLDREEEEEAWWTAAVEQVRSAPGRVLGLLMIRTHALLSLGGVGVLLSALALPALVARAPRRAFSAVLVASLPLALSAGGLLPADAALLWMPLSVWVGVGVHQLIGLRGRALGLRLLAVGLLVAALASPPLSAFLPGPALAKIPDASTLGCGLVERPRYPQRLEEEHARARAELEAGELEVAARRLGAILQAEPGHVGALIDLSALILEKGEPRAAEQMANRAVELSPCDPAAWLNLGSAWLRQGKVRDAARAFEEARRIDPWAPRYEAALGEALITIGETGPGLALVESSVRWGPELWQPRLLLGRRALTEGRFSAAEAVLAEALALEPDRPDVLALLGLARLGMGRIDLAEELLASAREKGLGRSGPILSLDLGIRRAREAAGLPSVPLDPAPSAPLDPAPSAPLDPAPSAPLDPAPSAPLDPAPSAPLDPAPSAP